MQTVEAVIPDGYTSLPEDAYEIDLLPFPLLKSVIHVSNEKVALIGTGLVQRHYSVYFGPLHADISDTTADTLIMNIQGKSVRGLEVRFVRDDGIIFLTGVYA